MIQNFIRKAEPKDASRLGEILIFAKRTAYRSIFRDDATSFNKMQVLDLALYYRDTEGALDAIHVYDDGIVKGMMHHSGHELKELYVDPFFQKQGVGQALLSAFIALSARKGASEVSLWVLEKNRPAIGFYRSLGFISSGEKRLEPGTDAYLIRYTKSLSLQEDLL